MNARTEIPVAEERILLDRAVAENPDKVAVRDEHGCVLTYLDLRRLVDVYRELLESAGVSSRNVVSLVLPNTAAYWAAFVAVRELDAVVNPIAPMYGPADLSKMLRRADPAAVVAIAEAKGRRLADEIGGLDLDAPVIEVPVAAAGDPSMIGSRRSGTSRILPEPAALVVFTSGSEGAPKGVVHSSHSFSHAARQASRMSGLSDRDTFLSAAPMGHLTGMFGGFRVPLTLGATAIVLDRWDPLKAREVIREHQVSYMHGPPTMLIDLVSSANESDASLKSLRMFRSGGAALASSVVVDAEQLLGIEVVRGYGASETLMVTNSLHTDDAVLRINTDGAILPDVEVELRPGDRGDELAIRGATRFMGYLPPADDPDPEFKPLDPSEWFLTGDLAELVGADHLKVIGRSKEIIVRGGLNISATEVENLLIKHPDISEAAVIPIPDPRLGERCCAVVVSADRSVTVESLGLFLDEQGLARFKFPEKLRFVDSLPRTGNGKVAKQELKRSL